MKRCKRVCLLDASNSASLAALYPCYTPTFLANLSLLPEAWSLEMKRRKRVSLLDDKNSASLAALDPSFTPDFLRGLSLPGAVSLEHQRRNHSVSCRATASQAKRLLPASLSTGLDSYECQQWHKPRRARKQCQHQSTRRRLVPLHNTRRALRAQAPQRSTAWANQSFSALQHNMSLGVTSSAATRNRSESILLDFVIVVAKKTSTTILHSLKSRRGLPKKMARQRETR
jgi:hypothetical protein